jgi:hypothetical protein
MGVQKHHKKMVSTSFLQKIDRNILKKSFFFLFLGRFSGARGFRKYHPKKMPPGPFLALASGY